MLIKFETMIRFLKDHCGHKTGDEVEHGNEDYLVRTGVAEFIKEKKEKKPVSEKVEGKKAKEKKEKDGQ